MLNDLEELLLNAEDNGWPVWDEAPEDILDDIIEQTGYFEEVPRDVVVEMIQTILTNHKGGKLRVE